MMVGKLKKLNFLFLFILILLGIIGFFSLYSAANGNLEPWAQKHIIRFIICFILLIVISVINIKFWYKHAYTFFLISLLLLFSVEILGTFGSGSKRWINIFGVSLQPSELVKITIILSLSRYYHDINFDRIGKIVNLFIPLLIILVPFFLIVIQPDLGTALMIILLGLAMMFIAGVKLWKFLFMITVFLISMPIAWNSLKTYQQKRVFSFLNPESDPLGSGYHLIQSKIALGSGGPTGKGFLHGTQSYLEYLPEKQTDFIFTLIGEEFGFIGTIFLLILFCFLIVISYYHSFNSSHIFGKILSQGVAINLFLYFALNTSMVTGLIPVVGVPLPLISYGGTAMLALMISFGLLMNTAIHSTNKKLK